MRAGKSPRVGVIARLPPAMPAELDAAIASAGKAQVEWAATNPQRRARAMTKSGALITEHMDELASREHGKTLPAGSRASRTALP